MSSMSLLKWMTLGTVQSAANSPAASSSKTIQPAPSAPDAPPESGDPALATARWNHKRFGMENFGNTCYANSVLQALYFCDPFRQLLCDAPDRSYPTGPAAVMTAPPAQPPPPPASQAAKSKPPHVRRGSAADARDLSTPHHMSFAATGASAFAAAAFVSAPGGVPHKTTSAPTPAPIVNVGPVIPAFPPSLFSALRSLYIHIAANPADKGTVSPRAFVEKLKKENELFRSNMHQDAHEFLNYLLNSVVEDLTDEMKAGPPEDLSKSVASEASAASHGASSHSPHLTIVHDLFEGTLTSETRCLTCETVSSRDESFLDLSIDIERNSSVTACLRQFSASEMLCQKNKFFCDSCCGLQEAEKRMKIKKLPNVLALHLKRFKYQEDVQRYIKLSYRVAFPFELRLFNTVDDAQDPDRLYELFAIVVHVGSGPHHGHYITIAKQRGQWLLFDDDIVEGIRESEIPKYFGDSPAGSGYVLFYQAVNIDLQALGVKTPPSPQTSTAVQPQAIPPVVVEAPTSPVAVEEKVEAKGSPAVSESGTIGTPSTPTPSYPPSSPVLSKIDAPSTAPSSHNGSGFKASVRQTPLSGSISALTESTTSSSNGVPNGDATLVPTTKNGKTRELSGSWFRWGSKKKSKETPISSRKTTADDQIPILDIRRPSAPPTFGSTLGPPVEHETPVLHDEPEPALAPTLGLGVDFGASGQMTDEPVSASVSASSSGDHLHSGALPQSVDHLHPHGTYKPVTAHTTPPRASRSGSVSGTTNGSASGSTSGLHVPSYRPSSQASPSASSSASSVSTPLRNNASAPKLNFPLTMSPVKPQKRPSTAGSSPAAAMMEREDPPPLPIPTGILPSAYQSPLRAQTLGFSDLPPPQPGTNAKTPKRKLSFSSALGTFGRSKDKSLSKIGHDRRISIAEDVEAMPQLIPNSPLKRK